MNETNTQYSAIHFTKSNLLILIIVAVLFSTFYLTDSTTAFSIRSGDPERKESSISSITTGSTTRRISLISLGIFWGLLLFRRRGPQFVGRRTLYWLILAYIFLAIFSVTWAVDHQLVMRRIVVLVILCVSAFSTSLNISLRQLSSVVLWTSLLVLILGIFSELSAGVFSLSFEGYRFAGTIHPNSQARNCAILFFAATVMAKSEIGMRRFLYRSVMLTALLFLLFTKSRATFVATIIALIILKIHTSSRSRNVAYVYILVLLFCIGLLILSDAFFPLLGTGLLLGREEEQFSQLSGRLGLWTVCIDFVKARPFVGYGFQGFWTEDRVRVISDRLGWSPHSSHSTYMENALNLGLIGLGVFLMMVIFAWYRARAAYLNRRDVGMGFALTLLTLWLAVGTLDRPVGGLDIFTYLFFAVLFGIARESSVRKNFQEAGAISARTVPPSGRL